MSTIARSTISPEPSHFVQLKLFAGSAAAFSLGWSTVGVVLALMIGLLAAFVAISNVCVPSIVFTLLWGERRATAARLFGGGPSLPAMTPLGPTKRPWVPVEGYRA